MPEGRRIVKAIILATPVLVTVYDQIGYVGIVRGCSMQVSTHALIKMHVF